MRYRRTYVLKKKRVGINPLDISLFLGGFYWLIFLNPKVPEMYSSYMFHLVHNLLVQISFFRQLAVYGLLVCAVSGNPAFNFVRDDVVAVVDAFSKSADRRKFFK